MSRVVSQVSIGASADRVWRVLVDSGSLAHWLPDTVKVDSVVEPDEGNSSPKPLRRDQHSELKEKATELEPGRSYSYVVSNIGPFKSSYSSLSLRDSEAGTLLSHTVDFRMKYGLLGAIVGRLMFRPHFRKQMDAALTALKQFMETRDQVATHPEGLHTQVA